MRLHGPFTGMHARADRTDEWLTPPWILDALGGAGSFDLDPCAPLEQPWPTARRTYTLLDNGLLLPWDGRVWLNPPYHRRTIGRWLGRMAAHGRGTALIFARTDTDAFHRFVWQACTALLFLAGRLDFHRPDGSIPRTRASNSGAPAVLVAYGVVDADVLAATTIAGQFVPLRIARSVIAAALAPTWREAIQAWFASRPGPIALADLYRAFAHHPKARGNRHVAAKIRQTLQKGPFERVGNGLWAAAGSGP